MRSKKITLAHVLRPVRCARPSWPDASPRAVRCLLPPCHRARQAETRRHRSAAVMVGAGCSHRRALCASLDVARPIEQGSTDDARDPLRAGRPALAHGLRLQTDRDRFSNRTGLRSGSASTVATPAGSRGHCSMRPESCRIRVRAAAIPCSARVVAPSSRATRSRSADRRRRRRRGRAPAGTSARQHRCANQRSRQPCPH